MHIKYICFPKNPNLNHCAESFDIALKSNGNSNNNECINVIHHLDNVNFFKLIVMMINLPSSDKMSLFLFAIQFKYLVLNIILRIFSKIFNKDLQVYYLMHEPRYEKGRINPVKAYIVYYYHLLIGYLADKIFLPSDEALLKAKTFIASHKLYQVNLTFASVPKQELEKNLSRLKFDWENLKTFSLLGTSSQDKNPQGFLSFADMLNKVYADKSQFIRAGRDSNIHVNYDDELIIRFPGYMSASAKKFLLGLTHFVVIPYSFSTQSGVIAEALSYGKLLIVNDIPAFSHLKELQFVFVIDFNDEKSILKLVDEIFMMNVNEYESRYYQSLKYFQENHSESYLAQKLLDVL